MYPAAYHPHGPITFSSGKEVGISQVSKKICYLGKNSTGHHFSLKHYLFELNNVKRNIQSARYLKSIYVRLLLPGARKGKET